MDLSDSGGEGVARLTDRRLSCFIHSLSRATIASPVDPIARKTGEIAADLVCAACGYNLRTLQVVGRCPECGSRVVVSLARHYDEREFHDLGPVPEASRWLLRVGWGCCIYVAAGLMGAWLGPLLHETMRVRQPSVGTLVWLPIWVLQGIGATLMTSPLEGEDPLSQGLRRMTRVLTVGGVFCSGMLTLLISMTGPVTIGVIAGSTPLPAMALGFAILSNIPGYYYLARLATRLKQPILGGGFLLMAGVSLVSMAMMVVSAQWTPIGRQLESRSLFPDLPLVVRGSSVGMGASLAYANHGVTTGWSQVSYEPAWLVLAYVSLGLLGWMGVEAICKAVEIQPRSVPSQATGAVPPTLGNDSAGAFGYKEPV